MRKITLLFIVLCNILFVSAQNEPSEEARQKENQIATIQKSINALRNDLQTKQLQYSYAVMEKYIVLCEKGKRIASINKDPQLVQLAFVTKPQEIEPQREAFEKAKKELQELLKAYPEYVSLDSLYKHTTNKNMRESIGVARNNFYSRLAEENKDYRPLRDKEQAALRQHYIAAIRYMLNECKKNREIMPTDIIDYSTERLIQNSNPELNQLSIEVQLLKSLQKELLRKYQELKYNVNE